MAMPRRVLLEHSCFCGSGFIREFSDGSFGALYLANRMGSAIAEARHHQGRYLTNVQGLTYERFTFRGLNMHLTATTTPGAWATKQNGRDVRVCVTTRSARWAALTGP